MRFGFAGLCGLLLTAVCVLGGTATSQSQPSLPQQQVQSDASSPSPMDYLNNQLPRWMRFSGQLRERAEGYTGGGFNPANDDQYVLTRVWINMSLQPNDWTQFFFQGMDARAFGKSATPAGPPFRDDMDLRQAYFALGSESRPVSVRFGRQELEFGDGRLVGALPWANTARTFDGVRGSVVGDFFRVDLFAASVVKIYQSDFDTYVPGNNFYGAYSSFPKLISKSTLQPFFFWRRQSGLKTEAGAPGISNYATVGARWTGKLPGGFDYDTTMAKQSGSLGSESIGAWAGHWLGGYTVEHTRYSPRFFAEYNYASGDHNATDNHRGTFDQLYPTGHDKYGLTDLVGWQNIEQTRAGAEVKLTKKVSATARYNLYWLADPHDALYNASAIAIARDKTGTSGRFVGQEPDVITTYKVNTRLTFAGGYGRLIPGTFLNHTTKGASYNYPYFMTVYDF